MFYICIFRVKGVRFKNSQLEPSVCKVSGLEFGAQPGV